MQALNKNKNEYEKPLHILNNKYLHASLKVIRQG